MFASRFDAFPVAPILSDIDGEHHSIRIVTKKTKGGLDELWHLVSNKDVRIDDFKTLNKVIAEMQSRRKSTMCSELEHIASFFATQAAKKRGKENTAGKTGVTGTKLSDTINANLSAAFSLLRYREVLVPFRTAVVEMELLPKTMIEILNDSTALIELQSNFLVAEAPRLRNEVDVCLQGLSISALALVGKLVNADLLMQFLKKRGQSFESDLDRAQQRYASDEFSSGVLVHLSEMSLLLQPFYSRSLLTLSDMKLHLDANLRMTQNNQDCLTVAYLVNVCENWTAVEMCFRDSGDNHAGTEDIQRSIKMYQETGQFISSLAAHPGGSSLSFSYVKQGGIRISLTPDLLQTHVQWAVLGGNVVILEEFVTAFGKAQSAHAICLKLEDEGHPDHQAINPPAALSKTCRIKDITDVVENLSRRLDEWRTMSSLLCNEYPRLLLLNCRSRVQFLLALRNTYRRASCIGLLPYVLQCFPALLAERNIVLKAIHDSFDALIIQKRRLKDLALAGKLIYLVQMRMEKCAKIRNLITVFNNVVCEATRLELHGSSSTDIYCQHLAALISQSDGIGMPGMVLWSGSSTTERAIRDLLLVARVPGLVEAVHVVGVDRLTPRMREVLLRGIEQSTLRAPLLLIFGDRDGADTFAQYESENNVGIRKPADVRKNLWTSMKSFAGKNNAEVWAVAGKSGMGKSHWILENLRKNKLEVKSLHFAVHEGFSAKNVIKRLKLICQHKNYSTLALCFNLMDVACYESFSQFLHHLLALGLIVDDSSGDSFAIPPGNPLEIYIELPQISSKDGTKDGTFDWPPADDVKWCAAEHPLLSHLPALVVAVAHDHYISIREGDAFILDSQAQLVAFYLLLAKNPQDFDTAQLPDFENLPTVDDCCLVLDQELFKKFRVGKSKRVRSFTLKLLYDKCLYLRSIDQYLIASDAVEGEERMQCALEVRMEGSFHKIFQLFIREALDIASDAMCLPETSVFTIRPARVEEFEVLITTVDKNSKFYQHLSTQFMESKALFIRDGVIPAEIRACVAPAFGIDDTSNLLSTLEDCGHLLTPESLVRILHMHGRRMLGASVIYEGETGVGKSQNLKLYSLLINANNSVFTNLKLHLVAVVRAVAESKHRAVEHGVEGDVDDRNATHALAHIDPSSSIEKVSLVITLIITAEHNSLSIPLSSNKVHHSWNFIIHSCL